MEKKKDNFEIGPARDSYRQAHVSGLILFVCGMLVFSTFASRSGGHFVLALGGLTVAVLSMTTGIHSLAHIPTVFGLGKLNRYSPYFLIISIGVGMLLGMVYRDSLAAGFLPVRLTEFTVLASLIGATEELLFRGYLQTNIRSMGIFWSVLLAALAHTAYKFMLFYSFDPGIDINLSGLAFWTLLGGIFFGVIREYSKSTLFPILAHVAFDIVVYGDRAIAPWWVWA
jgi:membrane protease YdiL (CAAX protease family)